MNYKIGTGKEEKMSYGVFIYRKETVEDFIAAYPKAKEILEEEGDWFDSNLVVGFNHSWDDEPYDIISERLENEISEEAGDRFAYELPKETFEYGG